MAWAYLVRCSDGSLYAGWTKDLQKRLAAHNAGTGAKYTRSRGPVNLAWAGWYKTQGEAMRQEARMKRMSRTQKQALAKEFAARKGGLCMRKAGIIGGMGPESTVEYYKGINRQYQALTGNKNEFPQFVVESINVYEMLGYCAAEEYDSLIKLLLAAVNNVHAAGAQYGALAANTPHIVFEELARLSPIPLLSIVEAACEAVQQAGIKTVALLGTRFTMQRGFFKQPFLAAGIRVVVPQGQTVELLDRLIVEELERGILKPQTRDIFVNAIEEMAAKDGAEGVILGCTELPLLLSGKDTALPVFDTMDIHIQKIAEAMLQ